MRYVTSCLWLKDLIFLALNVKFYRQPTKKGKFYCQSSKNQLLLAVKRI